MAAPEDFLFPNADGGFLDVANYRYRVLQPLARKLGLPKLTFQVLRRTMATQAQRMGSIKDIQAHLRHAKADTTANQYVQELPESVVAMVGAVYEKLRKGERETAHSRAGSEAATVDLLPIRRKVSL